MKKRISIIMVVAIAVFLSANAALSATGMKYYAVRMNNSGAFEPDDKLDFMKDVVKDKGYTGAKLEKSGSGSGSVEIDIEDCYAKLTFDGSKVKVLIKEGDKVFFKGTVLVKKKLFYIDGPKVKGGKLLFAFRKE
ncbi:MAG: hypothetical protein ACYS8W_12290 [Planctomycetota bacterium]